MTVCVPTIGRTEYLDATIASLKAQTVEDFEVLVLDNASTPRAAQDLEAWASVDRRVRVLRCEPRVPMFANFNRGVSAARTEYVAFCHDDDRLRPMHLERHLAFMDAHPTVGFAGSNYDFIDEHGSVIDRLRPIRRDGVWRGHDYIRTLMRSEYNPLTMQSIFFRTSVLAGRGFDESLLPQYGDFVVLMRMAETCDVGHLADSLVEVRRHSAQASSGLTPGADVTLRATALGPYCDEYAARWPRDRRQVAAMRAGLRKTHRRACLRGWLRAHSEEDARAALACLGRGPIDRALQTVLARAHRLGLVAHQRNRIALAAYRARRAVRTVRQGLSLTSLIGTITKAHE